MLCEILSSITEAADRNFYDACSMLEACVDSDKGFIDTLRHIEIIPEAIVHDSTQEKLFSKASDMCSPVHLEKWD